MVNPSSYLLPAAELDWQNVHADWDWLVPPGCVPLYTTLFGDVFLRCGNTDVSLLDLESGTFELYCDQAAELIDNLSRDDEAGELLYAPLVEKLRSTGMMLAAGKCYHFVTPTVLGGHFIIDNVTTLDVAERMRFCGDFHRQIKELPDGTTIKLKIVG